MIYTILVVLLILMLVGALPAGQGFHGMGYYPSGIGGILLLILIILLVTGRI